MPRTRRRQALAWATATFGALGVTALALSAATDSRGALLAMGSICLLLAAGLCFMSQRDGVTVLSMMLFCLFLIPENLVVAGPLKSVGNPAELLGLMAIPLWGAWCYLGVLRPQRAHPVRWAIFFVVVAALTSYVAGSLRILTGAEASAMTRTVFVMAAAIGIALMAVDGIVSFERLITLLQRLVLLASIAAGLGIVEFFHKSFRYRDTFHVPGLAADGEIAYTEKGSFDRVAVAAAHPIEYAVALGAIAPLALHFALHGRTKGERWRGWVGFTLILVVEPLGVSRGGLLTLVVGLLFYFVQLTGRQRWNLILCGIAGVGAFRAAVPGLLGTIRNLIFAGNKDSSIAHRTLEYQLIPGLMHGHWVFGRGLGTFVTTQYFILDNQYLGWLLEGGVVGVAAMLVLMVSGLCCARGARHRCGDDFRRGLGQAIAGGVAGLSVAAGAFDEMGFHQASFLLFLLVGCAGAFWTMTRREPRRYPNGVIRPEERKLVLAGASDAA